MKEMTRAQKDKNGTPHSPVLVFVLLKKLLHLLPLELCLVLIVAGNGRHFINGVLLLGEELLEAEHHMTLGGGVGRFSGDTAVDFEY